jgi:hypothetical protein
MASAAITVTAATDRPRRSANHLLKLRFEINGFKYDYTAGIPMVYEFYRTPADAQAIPEICPPITAFSNAAIDRSACHYRPVSSGAWLYTVEFRHPNAVADCLLIVSGTRGMKAWVDDQLVLDHDSCEYVPAFHRSENTAQIAFDANWHRLTIWVDAANAPIPPSDEESHQTNNLSLRAQRYLYDKKNLVSDQDGELFVGFSSRRGLLYLQEMEWRLPKIEAPEQ